jgi:D-amino-acid dehydrogenase
MTGRSSRASQGARSSARSPRSCSVIIVGSGHIGLACARYLRDDGFDVTVIDQGAIADACSHSNCGFIAPSHVLPLTTPGAIADGLTSLLNPRAAFRVKPQARGDLMRWMYEFARRCTHRRMLEAAEVLHTLLEASNEEFKVLLSDPRLACEWQQRGILFVFRTERALGEFADEDALLTREFGVCASYLDSAALAEFEPALSARTASTLPWQQHCRKTASRSWSIVGSTASRRMARRF